MASIDALPQRRNRRRSRILSGVAAVGASAALVAGGLAPTPAHAADDGPMVYPTSKCAPGETGPATPLGETADCTKASPAILGQVGDALIGMVLPGLGMSLVDLNSATVISLEPVLGDMFPGSASISGSGLASALSVGGEANASAAAVVSAAIAVGSLGAIADAQALGGLALSIGAGQAVTSANALPLGVALAFGMGENASATALGGVAVASGYLNQSINAPDPEKTSVICTALYGSAQVSDGETGKNISSCTSLGFLFQQSQQGDGPVVYSIKNPFSLSLAGPLGPLNELLDTVNQLGIPAPFPSSVTDIITGKVIPVFTQDLIRIVMTEDGPKFETDLFGKKAPTTTEPTAPVTAAAVTTTVAEPLVSDPAPTTSAPIADDQIGAAPAVTEPAVTEPAITEPAITEPAATEPPVTAPAVTEPAVTAPAPAQDAPAQDSAPAAESNDSGAPSEAPASDVAA